VIFLLYFIPFIILLVIFLPSILRLFGLHPHYKGENYHFLNKKALIITTSHSLLGETGKATGVFASEMTVPYYQFLDANIEVCIASILGGKVPIEKSSLKYPIATKTDKRFLKDPIFQEKVSNSLKIDNIDFKAYDIIFMAGGWGAAYDLGQSEILGEQITDANKAGKLIGSVCHGGLGFLQARDIDGSLLVNGLNMTSVTNKQIKELYINETPLHPETELRKAGAIYHSNKAFKDIFASLVITDKNIVTGQNQNSGAETSNKLMELLNEKQI